MFKFGRGLINVPTSFTVNANIRRINVNWSVEMAQDIQAFHNIDAEAELTALLSENLAREVDRQIINDLRLSNRWVIENILKIKPFKFGR